MSASVTVKNGQPLRDKLGKFTSTVPDTLNRALFSAAAAIMQKAQALIMDSSAKSGIMYPGARNRSSAPGEAPATQTGALQSSIKMEPADTGVGYRVFADENIALYAGYLEFGTHDKDGTVRIAPRPFLRPAVDFVSPTVQQLVSDAWKATYGE